MQSELSQLLNEEKVSNNKINLLDKGFRIPVNRLFSEEVILCLYKQGYGMTCLDYRKNGKEGGVKYAMSQLSDGESEIVEVIFITRTKNKFL